MAQDSNNINNSYNKQGYISKYFISALLDETELYDVIKDFVDLKKEGANYKGLSPFTEERTPSFVVSPKKQIWKDFSSGKGGNNAISFLMEKGHSFPEAIEYLAKKQGKSIEYDDTKEAKAYQEKLIKINNLRPILKRAIATYQKEFAQLSDNHPAKQELARRGYDQDIIDTYQIGYAPGNKFLYDKLKENGLVAQGKAVSLLSNNNDFYFNRVTYTIFDANGEPISIAGRDLQPDSQLKWINGRTTDLYQKEYVWYGLHIAKAEMKQTGTAYVMEGYNDVIAFQTHNVLNAVAPCGTSIHDNQIRVLKKYADVVYFAMDDDKSGRASALKNIPRFLEAGFRCYVISFKDCDPDEFVRLHSEKIEKEGLKSVLETEAKTNEGFKLLLSRLKNKDEVQKSVIAKDLCGLISKIKDDSIVEIYKKWLQKESSVNLTIIKKWVKEFQEVHDQKTRDKVIQDNEYDLPKGIEMTEQIMADIKRYQMFQANNQIYSQTTYDPPYKFRSCSNFSVNIIQHMNDEDFPKKLIAVKNVANENFVFDVPSDTFNSDTSLKKAMTNFGNFRWFGRGEDLTRLQALLFDKMGNGRSLEVLGWQQDGFYLFNNLVVVHNGENIEPDKNGCFKFKEISYYVPSANVVYKDNPYKYMPQKSFRHIPGTISEYDYFSKMHRVHGDHAISSIFFAIACMFHDIVAKHLKGFPINFSHGVPGTGKDELNHSIKSLWGIPQVATNLEGKNSTKTATIRELAQFTNSVMEWSEYKRGDHELDGTIKSVWDLRGKKTGRFESRIATDNVPVLSGVALTGNDYPDNPAIITRIIWNDMNRTKFTEEDEREFNELNDIIDQGITHITVKILEQRQAVEAKFNKEYRLLMEVYQNRLPECNKRMLKNISTLTAFYNVLKDDINFPFNTAQIIDHFTSITENQMRKLTSSSIIARWWDCFIASMRGVDQEKIKVTRELKLEGSLLYFQFTNCYNKIQRQWFSQYRDSAPGKSTMKEAIEKDICYHTYEKRVDFSKGLPRNQSSAMVIDILRLPGDLSDLIKNEIERQEFEMNLSPLSSVPLDNGINKEKNCDDGEQTDLPF